MGGSTVGHERARAPRFLEANVKSLILTIGAPSQIYNLRLLCPPPPILIVLQDFNGYSHLWSSLINF